MRTDVGNLAFNFALDEKTKYVTGSVHSRKIKLGKVLNMDKLDDVGAQATFIVDIHKARTAMIRKKNGGGKLPIGEVKATVFEAGYGGFRLKNMQVEFASNGSQAEGTVSHSKRTSSRPRKKKRKTRRRPKPKSPRRPTSSASCSRKSRNLASTLCPVATVKTTITDSLCDMVALHMQASFKVGNGTCHFQNAAVGTG